MNKRKKKINIWFANFYLNISTIPISAIRVAEPYTRGFILLR